MKVVIDRLLPNSMIVYPETSSDETERSLDHSEICSIDAGVFEMFGERIFGNSVRVSLLTGRRGFFYADFRRP